jgi:hypothetical protein
MLLESFDANASTAAVVDVLRRDGGVIVRDLAPVNLIDACAAELRSSFNEFDESQRTDFSGSKTLRCGGVLRRAPSCAELIAHQTYCLGWLRSEENHCLEVPPQVARQYTERVRRLLGYATHGAGHDQLGYYGGNDPVWVQHDEVEAVARGQVPGSADLRRPSLTPPPR